MIQRLVSLWQIRALTVRSRLVMIVGAVGAMWGVLTLSLTGPLWFRALGVGITLASAVSVAVDIRKTRREDSRLYVYEDRGAAALACRVSDIYQDWQDRQWRSRPHRYLTDPVLNSLLDSAVIPLELDGRFSLDPSVASLQGFLLLHEWRKGSVLLDHPKLRLAEDLTRSRLQQGTPLRLEHTSYFEGTCTNESADKEVRLQATDGVRFRGVSLCSDSRVLLDLAQSRCSNHIGVSTLAITSDGYLVTTVQARHSAKFPNQVAPSGSGSVDRADLPGHETLRGLVVHAMERELLEECGIRPVSGACRTALIGYARIVERGGKPEFFGFTRLAACRSEIRVARNEVVYVADARGHRVNRRDLIPDLKRLRREGEASFTPIMHVALELLVDAIMRGDPAVVDLLGSDRATSHEPPPGMATRA